MGDFCLYVMKYFSPIASLEFTPQAQNGQDGGSELLYLLSMHLLLSHSLPPPPVPSPAPPQPSAQQCCPNQCLDSSGSSAVDQGPGAHGIQCPQEPRAGCQGHPIL